MTSIEKSEAWMRQAGFDLEAARLSIRHGYFEWSSFQSQQSAEKALKGLLIFLDGYAPRGHRLGGLLGMANRLDPRVKDEIRVSHVALEAATFISRYPFAIPAQKMSTHEFIEKEEAEECLAEATDIYQQVTNFVNNYKQQ